MRQMTVVNDISKSTLNQITIWLMSLITGATTLGIKAIFLIFVCIITFSNLAEGQTDNTNIKYTQGEVSESAQLSLGVPLGGYSGRGLNLPISLNYSSSVWRLEHLNTVKNYNTVYYPYYVKQSVTEAIYAEHSTAGWKSSLDLPKIEWPKSSEVYTYQGKPSTITGVDGCYGYRVAKVFIHMPDGSIHELRKSDAPHQLGYIDTSGTFYAVDGSRMRFDATGTDTGTIYLPDGTKYVLESTSASITDKNGNTVTYNKSTGQWTDTLGRVFVNPIPAAPAAQDYTYTLPGLSGVSPNGVLTYTFKWRELNDALTPGTDNSTPSLRYIGSQYLPNPSSLPDDSSNYPQNQSTSYDHLFHEEYVWSTASQSNSIVPTLVVGKGQSGGQLFNPIVLTEIDLPDGTKYKFTYNVYGEVDKIVYPTNAYEKYEFEALGVGSSEEADTRQPYLQTDRTVKSHEISINGSGEDNLEWQYFTSLQSGGIRKNSTIAPDKTRTETYVRDPNSLNVKFGFTSAINGNVTERKAYSTSEYGLSGDLLRRELSQHEQTSNSFNLTGQCGQTNFSVPVTAYRNSRLNKNVSLIFEGSGSALAQTNEFSYDTTYQTTTGIDQTGSSTYGFAVIPNSTAQSAPIENISSGSLVKIRESVYQNDSAYRNLNILGLPLSVTIKDGNNVVVSRSEMAYDESGFSTGAERGLPTTLKTWDSTKGAYTNSSAYLATHATFDAYGNRTIATDAKGNSTTTAYDSVHHAYPISVTSPVPDSNGTYGSESPFTTSVEYDPTTGLVLSTFDVNGQETTMEYNDPLLRPTKITAPNGHETITEYGDVTNDLTRWVKVKTQIDSSNWSEAKSFFDGIGRTFKTEKTDSGGNIFTFTEYDNMSRVKRTTNPYKSGETEKWTTPTYDDLGRITKITTPESTSTPTTVQTSYGLSTSGVIGVTKLVIDQAQNKRKGITDAMGNTVRVIEDPGGEDLATDYVFDTMGNLRKTTQGEQNRYFMYDSLGRVLYAKQVEQDSNSSFSGSSYADPITGNNQWSVKYQYDDNSNISCTTNAKNDSITANYDHLNRLVFRDYFGSALDVTFYYDGKGLSSIPAYSKEKTSRIVSSISETQYTSFDSMGRLLASQQITDGQTYDFSYSYNLSGSLIEETYPSHRVVKNTLNQDGELAQVQSKKNANTGFWTYASGFTHNASGAVTKIQFGNGHWETALYNERLQVTQIGLGTTDITQNLLNLEFKYNAGSNSNDNNGSLREQKITVPGVGIHNGFTATQTYSYDNLNRIKDATETISSQTWKQTFEYDRYGNRKFDTANNNTTTLPSGCPTGVCNPTFNTANNRYAPAQGYSYDANGNVTQDAAGQRFGYDPENRQKEFFTSTNSTTTPDATYYYDGEGRRVKKISAAETTVFVYDSGGKLAAEYSTALAPEPQVSYLTADHLGSPRITTNASGAVISRRDFSAFGEETVTSQRTTDLGYNSSPIRQNYTGYQQDSESGLEYAQARYYKTQHGRFTSVDPLPSSAAIKNPQTFNRYSYVLNSPYKFTDPLGLTPSSSDFHPQGGRFVNPDYLWENAVGYGAGKTRPASNYIRRMNRDVRDISKQKLSLIFADPPAPPPQASMEQNSFTSPSASGLANQAGASSAPRNPFGSASKIFVLVWNIVQGFSKRIQGHVSYLVNGEYYSWDGETAKVRESRFGDDGEEGVWTRRSGAEVAPYVTDLLKNGGATMFQLDFGPELNNQFIESLTNAYNGTKYDFFRNNCGQAFHAAFNSVAQASGIKLESATNISPASHSIFLFNLQKSNPGLVPTITVYKKGDTFKIP